MEEKSIGFGGGIFRKFACNFPCRWPSLAMEVAWGAKNLFGPGSRPLNYSGAKGDSQSPHWAQVLTLIPTPSALVIWGRVKRYQNFRMIQRNNSDALLRIGIRQEDVSWWQGVNHGTGLEWGPIPITLCSRGRHGCFAFAAMNQLKSTISPPKLWYGISMCILPQNLMVDGHHFPSFIP